MNKYLISLTVCIFFVSSCASVEVTTNNVENEKESPFEIDENQKFLDFLEADLSLIHISEPTRPY